MVLQPTLKGVPGRTRTPDQGRRIEQLAECRLRRNGYLVGRNLACRFQDGTLFLEGTVPTYYLKQLAQAAVGDIGGVVQVANRIVVVSPRGPAPMAGARRRAARRLPRRSA